MPDPINVPVPCTCPQVHEDGDVVYLAPHLGLRGGLAVEAAMTEPDATVAVSMALIEHNVLGWSKTDERGDPIPVTSASIEEHLPWARGGEIVANKAAGLYLEDAFAPFQKRRDELLQSSRTNGQTRPLLTSRSRPKRKPSSSRGGSAGARSATNP